MTFKIASAMNFNQIRSIMLIICKLLFSLFSMSGSWQSFIHGRFWLALSDALSMQRLSRLNDRIFENVNKLQSCIQGHHDHAQCKKYQRFDYIG